MAHLSSIYLAGWHLRHDVHSPTTVLSARTSSLQLYYTPASVQRCVALLPELSVHTREPVQCHWQLRRDTELGQGTVSVTLTALPTLINIQTFLHFFVFVFFLHSFVVCLSSATPLLNIVQTILNQKDLYDGMYHIFDFSLSCLSWISNRFFRFMWWGVDSSQLQCFDFFCRVARISSFFFAPMLDKFTRKQVCDFLSLRSENTFATRKKSSFSRDRLRFFSN